MKYQDEQKMADTLRFLAVDMVQKANSGHPGAPMGLAEIAVILSKHLKHNPKNPKWLNRDRLVFSGGHATPLIYSLLYLWGYDVSLEDLKNFRQLDSKTPGHPEYGHTPGVEITTGPLGQGVASAVGFAMASKYLGNLLNRENANLIDHKVYCFCGDGDLQEGISYEACSLAGHHKLDNLILIYDSNNITIEGDTSIAWSENIRDRFQSQGWAVLEIDGHNFEEIDSALQFAKTSSKPIIIIAKTTIGKGSINFAGSHKSHGSPLGEEDIRESKIRANFPEEDFHIPEDVLARFRTAIDMGELFEKEWEQLKRELPYPEQNTLLNRLENVDWDSVEFPTFEVGTKLATRESNGKILNAIAKAIPNFVGGSADLGPSNKTELKDMGDFPNGKNFHFGIREFAMGAIGNGLSAYGLLKPFTATFFVFSDYLKSAVRVASLSKLQHFFIWTHDSIGVGEDGPTHQPIEQLTQFRALPNFYLFRPADAHENILAWKTALKIENAPSGFVLSRQKLPVLDLGEDVKNFSKGGYRILDIENPQVTLLATGSEVVLALESGKILNSRGIPTRVVSVPCFDLLIEQDREYIDSLIPKESLTIAIEAGRGLEWFRFADEVIGMETFGASAPANQLFEKFGFTTENIIKKVEELI
ncbi:MAG TPA: transketolase [Campylobacterales bacterium]|nr:transketolase [Campylobacterales bacterium]HIO71348.1 transketolase [Campylobacterales bacterium]